MTSRHLTEVDMTKIVSLAKRRGFVFPSSEIYGGIGSTWDYGPLGVELKRNVKEAWWRSMVYDRDDIVGLDSAIIQSPDVWVASGHAAGFTDPLVECPTCHKRYRADHLLENSSQVIVTAGSDLKAEIIKAEDLPVSPPAQHDLLLITGLVLKPEVESTLLMTGSLTASDFHSDVRAELALMIADRVQEPVLFPGRKLSFETKSYAIAVAIPPNLTQAELVLGFTTPTHSVVPFMISVNNELQDPEIPPRLGVVKDLEVLTCPDDGAVLSEPKMFNLMFETYAGPVQDSAAKVWLRPETAQGIFINFDNVIVATRKKVPFGIAQIGKSFRNEITPGNFIFRTREFEQMEMEFFVKPGEDDQWYDYWIKTRFQWFLDLGIREENLRLRPHEEKELAHYAKGATDIEYLFPWGWAELEGIANRTDFDLSAHEAASGAKLKYFDQELNEHYWPYVIEPALGADRAALALLIDAYEEEPVGIGGKEDVRVVLKFHPDIAPVQVAVLPLSKKAELLPKAQEVHATLRRQFRTQYDDAQSIGRRYRRQDEIGTPLCVTVDFETVNNDDAVTIRNRDTMAQVRVPIAELADAVREQLRAMGSTRV